MKFSNFVAVALASVFGATSLFAQGQDQYAWGVAGGITIPSGPARDNHGNGAHGTMMIGIGGVDSPFGVRFDLMYSSLSDADSAGTLRNQGAARVTSLSGNILFSLYGSGKRLYVLGGVGGFGYNPNGPGTSAVNDFGVSAGAGVWFPNLNGFIEARWMNLYRALPDPITGDKGKKSARLYPISVGVMF